MEQKPSGFKKWAQTRGYLSSRNLFWSWYEPRNFGDWIGPFLFRRLSAKRPLYCDKTLHAKTTCLFSAGSILRHLKQPDCATIWGTGIISRTDSFAKPRKVLAVRGPETRDAMIRLGYECPAVYGDPGILLPLFTPTPKRHIGRVGVIPHFIEFAEYKEALSYQARVIDVCRPVEDVATEIASCEMTYSSSLHGVIVSHAFGVPSIWMASSKRLDGDDVKFDDYFASCGISAKKRNSLLDTPRSAADEGFATLPEHYHLRKSLLQSSPHQREL